MKKSWWLVLLFILAGCSEPGDGHTAYKKGIAAVAEDQFQQAEAFFELAGELAPADKAMAEKYQQELDLLQTTVDQLENGELQEAKTSLKRLEQRQPSLVFKRKASELRQAISQQEKSIAAIDQSLNQLRTAIDQQELPTAQTQWDELVTKDLTPAYFREERQILTQLTKRLQQLAVVTAENEQRERNTGTEKAADEIKGAEDEVVPQILQGAWYLQPKTEPERQVALTITDQTLTLRYNQQVYQLTSVSQKGAEYTLYWDLNAFTRRYGTNFSAGELLPFQVYLTKLADGGYKMQMGDSLMYSE